MKVLSVTIPGTPQQQGSKTRNPHGFTREDNTDLAPWRKDALAVLRERFPVGAGGLDSPVFAEAVIVRMIAVWARPASHYGTGRNAGKLKPSAPRWKTSNPDLDKVQRALGDVLTQAGIVLDDRLIVGWEPYKVWGPSARMEVTVRIPEERDYERTI